MAVAWLGILLVALSLPFALPAGALAAPAVELGLITGGERGTYYQFGLDIQKLVSQAMPTMGLNVYPSKGSVENIYAVYQRPGTQMGIVQSDVLAFVFRVQTIRFSDGSPGRSSWSSPCTTRRSTSWAAGGSPTSTTSRTVASRSVAKEAGPT